MKNLNDIFYNLKIYRFIFHRLPTKLKYQAWHLLTEYLNTQIHTHFVSYFSETVKYFDRFSIYLGIIFYASEFVCLIFIANNAKSPHY